MMNRIFLLTALMLISTSCSQAFEAGDADQVLRVDTGAANGSRMKAGSVDVSKNAAVTGTLKVSNGGTGQTTYTDGFLKSTSDVVSTQAQIQTADIANGAVDTDQLADASVTAAKLSLTVNTTLTSDSGTFVRNGQDGTAFIDVTNLSAAITTNGRPVVITLEPHTASTGEIKIRNIGNQSQDCHYQFLRGATSLGEVRFALEDPSSQSQWFLPPGAFYQEDHGASAATHTYKMQVRASNAGGGANYCQWLIQELKFRVRELN